MEQPRREPRQKKEKAPRENLHEKYQSKYDFDPEHISLDTVIPEGPKKAKKPSRNDLSKKEAEYRKQIERLQEKKNGLFAKPEDRTNDAHEQFFSKMEIVRELKAQKRTLFEQLNAIRQQIGDLRDVSVECKDRLKFLNKNELNSKEAIAAKIKSLQLRQLRDKLSKKEENDIYSSITELERLLTKASPAEVVEKEIETVEAKLKATEDAIARLKEKKEGVSSKIDDIDKKLDGDKAELDRLRKAKDEKKEEREVKKTVNTAEADKIRAEISEIRDKIDKLWQDYSADNEAYVAYRVHTQWVGWAERQKAKLRRRMEDEAEDRLLQAESDKEKLVNPYIAKRDGALSLLEFVRRLMPSEDKHQEKEKTEQQELKLEGEFAGLQIVSKKKREEEEPRGKKKGKQDKKKKQEAIELSFDQLKMFEEYDVPTPRHLSELQVTEELLKAKVREFEAQPWPPAQ